MQEMKEVYTLEECVQLNEILDFEDAVAEVMNEQEE
jgi:hypothetical protein